MKINKNVSFYGMIQHISWPIRTAQHLSIEKHQLRAAKDWVPALVIFMLRSWEEHTFYWHPLVKMCCSLSNPNDLQCTSISWIVFGKTNNPEASKAHCLSALWSHSCLIRSCQPLLKTSASEIYKTLLPGDFTRAYL